MIGILGASGDIGKKALCVIAKDHSIQLKCSTRNKSHIPTEIMNEYPEVMWEEVDVSKEDEIVKFVDNCSTILNCIGPSAKYSEKIADICLEKQCKFVDVGFCDSFYERKAKEKETLIFGAGTTPGISSILVRTLAKEFEQVIDVKYIIGAIEEFSYAGAWDYIHGIIEENNIPLSSYKNGTLVPMSCKRENGVELPFFTRPIDLRPYTDRETKIIQDYIKANEAKFYLGVDGQYLEKVMNRLRMLWEENQEKAIEEIRKACKLETLEKEPYLRILVEMEGVYRGENRVKTLYLYTKHSSIMTATTGAMTAIYAEKGRLREGIYPCTAIEKEEQFVNDVLEAVEEKEFMILDSTLDALMFDDEGEI